MFEGVHIKSLVSCSAMSQTNVFIPSEEPY